ncbi:CGNR zinc finger domain-containing protein [Mycobacterium deserti]|uniref:CGNR zinc finger domain-containing protein n=1 Tax=Mycobacterium deserti TaxID=2978347 RepID=A0ABT2MA48_9MYCO|nr:ABATE domain-containing protein [Mycobacterium deserti]MCT7659135.1 CGNR zinc finger domain-containing protein [Mycobacterium deserti]
MVTPWQDGHFVGGHPILDLTNTVFNRAHPATDNELLAAPADVLSWCESAGLLKKALRMTDAAGRRLVTDVREVREHAWAVFEAMSRGDAVPAENIGWLLERAGVGARMGHLARLDARGVDGKPDTAEAIPSVLSAHAVHAYFTLPSERIRSCDRCGWLFLDSSRSGRRRWCSMSTCGNREKASRHRRVVSEGPDA